MNKPMRPMLGMVKTKSNKYIFCEPCQNKNGVMGTKPVSLKVIAKEAGLSTQTVRKSLIRLAKSGALFNLNKEAEHK